MTAPVKLCKDCRWHRSHTRPDFAKCAHSTAMSLAAGDDPIHLIAGGGPKEMPFCKHARRPIKSFIGFGCCGTDASLFEPKPRRWWQFWRRK